MTGTQEIQVQANTGSMDVELNYITGQSVWDHTFDFTFRALVENLNQMEVEISANIGQGNLISQFPITPDWILSSGFWDDSGVWHDEDSWND